MLNESPHALADFRMHPTPLQSSEPAPRDDSLLTRFDAYFSSLTADTPELVRAAQMIRYQVYCVENPLEDIENDERIDTDGFDAHSVHSVRMYRAANAALGTVRAILPLPEDVDASFALRRVVGDSAWR